MKRRLFIASLVAAPAVVRAAVTAPVVAAPALDLNAIFADLYAIKGNQESVSVLLYPWMQTSRITHCVSIPYEDAIDLAMDVPEPERRANWHERRKKRSRENLALLKTQRPLPI